MSRIGTPQNAAATALSAPGLPCAPYERRAPRLHAGTRRSGEARAAPAPSHSGRCMLAAGIGRAAMLPSLSRSRWPAALPSAGGVSAMDRLPESRRIIRSGPCAAGRAQQRRRGIGECRDAAHRQHRMRVRAARGGSLWARPSDNARHVEPPLVQVAHRSRATAVHRASVTSATALLVRPMRRPL